MDEFYGSTHGVKGQETFAVVQVHPHSGGRRCVETSVSAIVAENVSISERD